MTATDRRADPTLAENRLLAALPRGVSDRLLDGAADVTLRRGEVVYRAHGPVRHVYFPRSGILSVVVDMADGGTVEVGTVGNEGMAGLPAFHGADTSQTRTYCQVPPCVCRRVPAATFRREAERPGPLRDLLSRYVQFTLNLSAQSTACNRLHPVEARLARWLLLTQDRVAADELSLTQQIMSEMLGVRRPSVTLAAQALQAAGLVRYRRGRVTVLDRAGLGAAACECYRVVRAEFERLFG
jgi:CRP-like cAMP-binding protein